MPAKRGGRGRGRKRRASTTSRSPSPKADSSESADSPAAASAPKRAATSSQHESASEPSDSSSQIKIVSWNVGGLRALIKKDGMDYLFKCNADIICLQEVRCAATERPPKAIVPGYVEHWKTSKKNGYAGVSVWTKKKPMSVKYGIEDKEQDEDGRAITVEFDDFYLINVYVPNAGRNLVTLPKRLRWNDRFLEFCKRLEENKPLIIVGDMNVAHKEIDIANPKANVKRAGFTVEERDGMTDFLNAGYVDSFRMLHPDETGKYTFWTYMSNARARNVGWRLDYSIVSKSIENKVCSSDIDSEVMGSDHCPITLTMSYSL